MSIEIDWAALTTGPDGLALAEQIRDVIHERFQQINLPRFIQSVQVRSFEFGATAPEIEIRDIGDPLPDFYEDAGSADDEEDEEDDQSPLLRKEDDRRRRRSARDDDAARPMNLAASGPERDPQPTLPSPLDPRPGALRPVFPATEQMLFPSLGVNTPGIPGGSSNLSYFHLPRATGLSGSQTPLAAVAGRQGPVVVDGHRNPQGSWPGRRPPQHEVSGSATRPSTADSMSSDLSDVPRDRQGEEPNTDQTHHGASPADDDRPRSPEVDDRRPTDVQIVLRLQYLGDVKLSLTAEILLDYPMPSFVGIPLQLNITGLSFHGLGLLASIRNRLHFCFLSPEDAGVIVADSNMTTTTDTQPDLLLQQQENNHPTQSTTTTTTTTTTTKTTAKRHSNFGGGLLQEIRVESEIGQRDQAKPSLKNVGKVEKFVLEQVRRIFDNELVYPNYWTFLI